MALLVLIPLLGYVLFWQRLLNVRSSSAALHATSAVLVILYVAALLGIMRSTAAILLIAGSLLAVYESVILLRSRQSFPTPLGVLLILCGLFWLLHHESYYTYYDEYAHWGVYLKEMLAAHELWGNESNAMHLRYLPGPAIWQYFFLVFTEATEGEAFLAQFCLLMMPLLVLWHRIKWRQLPWILGVLALVALVLANFGHGFRSLYVDHLLGTWFAGILFNFMLDLKDRSPMQLVTYVLPLTTLVLLKDSGLYFAAAAIVIMAFLIVWRVSSVARNRVVKKSLSAAAMLAIIWLTGTMLATVSWNANRDSLGIPQSTMSFEGIVFGLVSGESSLSELQQSEFRSRFHTNHSASANK